jgi:hypothetical protein
MQEDQSPKDKQENPSGPPKKGLCLLDKLIVVIVAVTIGYVGITFVNCNFMVPGSIERANALGGLKNPPPLECEESTSQGYNALFMLLTAILGLKAKVED